MGILTQKGELGMEIINITKNVALAKQVVIADKPYTRLKGLLGKKNLPSETAMLLMPCNCIHSCFMRFAFDAVFLGESGQVVHIRKGVKPFTVTPIIKAAKAVLEVPSGTINLTNTEVGDILVSKGGVILKNLKKGDDRI
jgi:hypothetical protein